MQLGLRGFILRLFQLGLDMFRIGLDLLLLPLILLLLAGGAHLLDQLVQRGCIVLRQSRRGQAVRGRSTDHRSYRGCLAHRSIAQARAPRLPSSAEAVGAYCLCPRADSGVSLRAGSRRRGVRSRPPGVGT